MIFGQSCPWLVTSTANKYWVWPWGETLLFPLLPTHRRSLFPQLSRQKHERENTTTWTGAYRHFIVPGSDYNTFIWWCFPTPKSELFSILWKASAIRFSIDCTKPSPFVLRCAVDNDLNNKHSQGFPKKHIILERHRAVKSCAEESNCSLRDKQLSESSIQLPGLNRSWDIWVQVTTLVSVFRRNSGWCCAFDLQNQGSQRGDGLGEKQSRNNDLLSL